MPYLWVKDFQRGLDVRRMIETTEPGALIEGDNCHITRGGEIEKRKAFVPIINLPATPKTYGLWVEDGPKFHVFAGNQASAVAARPADFVDDRVVWHSLQYPILWGGESLSIEDFFESMVGVRSVEIYAGKLYVVSEWSHGQFNPGAPNKVFHHYDDKLVTDEIIVPPGSGDQVSIASARAWATTRFLLRESYDPVRYEVQPGEVPP